MQRAATGVAAGGRAAGDGWARAAAAVDRLDAEWGRRFGISLLIDGDGPWRAECYETDETLAAETDAELEEAMRAHRAERARPWEKRWGAPAGPGSSPTCGRGRCWTRWRGWNGDA